MSTFKLLGWNVRSIVNESKLHYFLQLLEDDSIDVALISETWFSAMRGKHTATIQESGYKIVHAVRDSERGGGVAILNKRKHTFKSGLASTTQFSSFEYAFSCLQVQKKTICFLCIYRKGEISCSLFCKELKNLVKTLFTKYGSLVIFGDFNVWVDMETSDAKRVLSLLSSFGLNQLVKDPTHEAGHTLDLLFINDHQLTVSQYVRIEENKDIPSDHFPVLVEILLPTSCPVRKLISFRKMNDVNIENLKNELILQYDSIDLSTNFAAAFNTFSNVSKMVFDEHAPVVTKFSNDSLPAWMDEDFKSCRRERRRLERKVKKNLSDLATKIKYIKQRKLCVEKAIEKKSNYYSNKIKYSDRKTLFKMVDEMLDKNQKRVLPSYESSIKLANDFNKFFVEKVKSMRSSIPTMLSQCSYRSRFNGVKLNALAPTTSSEISELYKMHGVKTCSIDPIPTKILSSLFSDILPYYVSLINLSFKEASVDGLKQSVIDPALKNVKLDTEIFKNYRPISNSLFFSKLIERVVLRRLDTHMTTNSLHIDSQYGYKKHHSTESMLLSITDVIFRNFDAKKCTVSLFLDLSAAFDTIDINKLLQILSDEIGVDGLALKWFKSFLMGRKQSVRIDNAFSNLLDVLFGVPQGSVLGPFLFSIYVRSLPMVFSKCKFKSSSFADDSNGNKSFSVCFQFDALTTQITDCLTEVKEWMHHHFLKINADKTEIIVFYPDSWSESILIKGVIFENTCIRFSSNVKNVGIWLDDRMKFDKHVNFTISHCYKMLKDIGSIRSSLKQEDAESLVHATIMNKLDYCNSLLYGISSENLRKLQKVQNAAARLIYQVNRRTSISPIIFKLHWLRIESRIIFKIIILTHKFIWGFSSLNFDISYKVHTRSDDHLLLQVIPSTSKYIERSFSFAAPRYWNALSYNIRSEMDTDKFKKLVKSLLLTDTDGLKRHAFVY